MSEQLHRINPLGENCLLVSFGDAIDPDIHARVKRLADYLGQHPFHGFVEYVISYRSLAVFYEPLEVAQHYSPDGDQTIFETVSHILDTYVQLAQSVTSTPSRLVEIPVCYDEEFGPDLQYVADYHGLTTDEVIKRHTAGEYLVYMIGFSPGFPFLGGLDPSIATPRKDTPRLAIPARSVGIAGQQTGAYPISTPGGWQLIGRSAVDLFDPNREQPNLLQAGDRVKFKQVSLEDYKRYRKGGRPE